MSAISLLKEGLFQGYSFRDDYSRVERQNRDSMKRRFILILVGFGLLLSLQGFNPGLVSEAKTASQGDEPIIVSGRMKVFLKGDERSEFFERTERLFGQTLSLEDPIMYECSESINQQGEFFWNELWHSKRDFLDHLETDHFKLWFRWVEPRLTESLHVDYVELSKTKLI